jgi:hypothetical protein
MKKLKTIILIMIVSLSSYGQDFKTLIEEYESYANEMVTDTIIQHGAITETLEKIKGSTYYQIKLDTVWKTPSCPEFKTSYNMIFYGGSTSSNYSLNNTGYITLDNVERPLYNTAYSVNVTRPVSREYICECKRREVAPFSNHFWKWIKEN